METIHIFDEFTHAKADILHEKRTRLEPLIFDILKRKYFRIFEEFWRSNSVIKETNKSIIIVERRIHENLAFILRNVFYYARDWAITVVCSDVNYTYIKTICTNNRDNISIVPLLQGNPDRDTARAEYNDLLKTSFLYAQIPYEHLFFVEMDSYLRKPIDESMFQYDYVAAPYSWDETSAGGGMSYRKRTVMLDICMRFKSDTPMQDCYALEGVKATGYKMPDFETGLSYISESCYINDPMGVHQWWTFFTVDQEYSVEVFHNYLKLEIIE
jgi:hypothetical protein